MEQTNELREMVQNIKLSGGIDSKDEFAIEEILKNIEDAIQAATIKNDRLQKRIDTILKEIDEEPTQEQGKVEPMTLTDERKWKIVKNLVHNLTEEELTKLETFAKSQFKKPGIVYQEVL